MAIDLGSRALKVVWAAAHRDAVTWHAEQRPRHPEEPAELLARKLADLLSPLQRRRFDIPVLLAVPQAHVRVLTIEAPRDRDLTAAIRERIPKLFPFELARCRYQYRVVARQAAPGARRCTVQVAACDLERLRRDADLLERIGWIPSAAFPAALALGSLARAQGRGEGAVFLLDVSAARSVLAVAVDGQVVFSREVSLGTDDLTNTLMAEIAVGEQALQLSREQAESLRDRVGLLPPETVPGAVECPLPLSVYRAMLQPVLEQWLEEVQRTVRFAEAAPKRLLLSGDGSELAGFDRWLEQQLGMPVERLTPLELRDAGRPPAPSAGAFAVPYGLLMNGGSPRARGARAAADPNLLPARSLQHRRLIRTERLMTGGLLVTLAVVWLAAFAVLHRTRPLQRQLAPLERRWQAFEPVRTLLQAVVARTKLIGALEGSRAVTVDWFKRLANGFPNPIRLTELSVEAGGAVSLEGQAQAREQTSEAYLSELAIWLPAEQVCDEVLLGSSQRNAQVAGLVDFSLTCRH